MDDLYDTAGPDLDDIGYEWRREQLLEQAEAPPAVICNCRILGLPCECPNPKGGRPAFRPCGTLAAYKRHYRHGETPCQACKQAWSRWWQDRGSAQREARRQQEQRRQAA